MLRIDRAQLNGNIFGIDNAVGQIQPGMGIFLAGFVFPLQINHINAVAHGVGFFAGGWTDILLQFGKPGIGRIFQIDAIVENDIGLACTADVRRERIVFVGILAGGNDDVNLGMLGRNIFGDVADDRIGGHHPHLAIGDVHSTAFARGTLLLTAGGQRDAEQTDREPANQLF